MDYESYSGVDDPHACPTCGTQGCTDPSCTDPPREQSVCVHGLPLDLCGTPPCDETWRCPGCGCRAGDGLTADCHHPDGCGHGKAVHGGLSSQLPEQVDEDGIPLSSYTDHGPAPWEQED